MYSIVPTSTIKLLPDFSLSALGTNVQDQKISTINSVSLSGPCQLRTHFKMGGQTSLGQLRIPEIERHQSHSFLRGSYSICTLYAAEQDRDGCGQDRDLCMSDLKREIET